LSLLLALSRKRPAALLLAGFLLSWGICPEKAAAESVSNKIEESAGDASSKKTKEEKAPSFDKHKWTGTQGAFELNSEYNFIAPASQAFGNGTNGRMPVHYFELRQRLLRRTLLAFLVQAGAEYQHFGFDPPSAAYIPEQLDVLNGFVAIDFRWSRKDMLRIQAEPGFYTDFDSADSSAINVPVAVAYTRVPNKHFQWVLALSVNTLRKDKILPGGGFRWQMNDRWKLKFFMPQPQIEYRARPDLHLFAGADFRGNSYRVSKDFGTDRGNRAFNDALVDYQEIRVGPGFSWNVKPLIELNFQTGYMLGREFDYHNNGLVLRSGKAPFVNLAIHVLLKLPGEEERIPQRNQIRFRDIFKFL
jgi:hypothetical protein